MTRMTFHRTCISVCVVLSASLAVAAEHTKDSLDKVKENVAQKKALIVDVREQGEWDEGHLAGTSSCR